MHWLRCSCTVEVLVHWLSVVQSELGVAGVVHSGSGVYTVGKCRVGCKVWKM